MHKHCALTGQRQNFQSERCPWTDYRLAVGVARIGAFVVAVVVGYVVGAVVLVVVVVCVGLWGVLDGRGGQPRCAHSAPCREDSLQQPLQKAGSWTAYPFRRLLVVAVVAAGGRYLRRRVVSVS